tara:strand:+ start:6608 stop:8092 length:1485 start_codon:yes stop_codon:yes gene_type:complete
MNKNHIILFLIFLLTLSARLYFSFQTPYFNIEGYETIRHVEHIGKNGMPLFKDALSYGGRTLFFPPLYYYVLAVFNLFLPMQVVLKVLPNVFMSSLVFVIYVISNHITKNKKIALFTALLSGFIPAFFHNTINDLSVYTLVVPLTALLIFCFMKIEEDKRYVSFFIVLILVLRLIHPSVIVLSSALLVFLMMIKLIGLKQSKIELELILFSTFLILWSLFITFRKAFLAHGYYVIWQNIPAELLSRFFSEVTVLEAIYKVGIIPFIFGLFIAYKYIFIEKNRDIYLLISFAFLSGILLVLRLIELNVGLMFLSVIFVLLFPQAFKMLLGNLRKTHFHKYGFVLIAGVCIVFVFTSVIHSATYANESLEKAVKPEEIRALDWLKENSGEDDTVLSTLEEGVLVTAIAHRKNVGDTNFLLIDDADVRLKDIMTIYITPLQTEAIRLLDKYDVKYIYFSERAKEEFGVYKLSYVDDKCFEMVYEDGVEIYKSLCVLQ